MQEFHANISFPAFKYWYFNADSTSKDKIAIMPSIRKYFSPRQKVNIEARGDRLLNELMVTKDLVLLQRHLVSILYRKKTYWCNRGKYDKK